MPDFWCRLKHLDNDYAIRMSDFPNAVAAGAAYVRMFPPNTVCTYTVDVSEDASTREWRIVFDPSMYPDELPASLPHTICPIQSGDRSLLMMADWATTWNDVYEAAFGWVEAPSTSRDSTALVQPGFTWDAGLNRLVRSTHAQWSVRPGLVDGWMVIPPEDDRYDDDDLDDDDDDDDRDPRPSRPSWSIRARTREFPPVPFDPFDN